MSYRQLLLARVAFLQREIEALAALIVHARAPAPPPAVHAEAPAAAFLLAEAPQPLVAPVVRARRMPGPARWSYAPSAAYRLTGPNPFRDGAARALFAHLEEVYGDQVFTRPQLGRALRALRADGVIRARQDDHALVIAFVKFAGVRGSLEMATAPAT